MYPYGQLVRKMLWRSVKDEVPLKAIGKYQYGLRKTVSKHLKLTTSQTVQFTHLTIIIIINPLSSLLLLLFGIPISNSSGLM